MLFEVSHAAWHIWWISATHFAHLSRELTDAWEQVQAFKIDQVQGLPMHLKTDGVSTSLSLLSLSQPVYLVQISAHMPYNRSALYSLSSDSEYDNDKSQKSAELLLLLFALMFWWRPPLVLYCLAGGGCRFRIRNRAWTFLRPTNRSSSGFWWQLPLIFPCLVGGGYR